MINRRTFLKRIAQTVAGAVALPIAVVGKNSVPVRKSKSVWRKTISVTPLTEGVIPNSPFPNDGGDDPVLDWIDCGSISYRGIILNDDFVHVLEVNKKK